MFALHKKHKRWLSPLRGLPAGNQILWDSFGTTESDDDDDIDIEDEVLI